MSHKPHIIIVNPDEMRWDTMGHMGNPAAITPNLDRLARTEAVSFSNAYCQNPVCVPSRCSFFTGLYPHVNGHRTMTHLLRPGETTLLKELKDAGYYVWMNDRNDLCAGQYPGWVESHADEIFYPNGSIRTPGPVKKDMRGKPGNPYFYSHFEGELALDANGKNYTADDQTIDAAIEKIRNWQEGDKPLCMFLGLFYPHTPYQVEEPYFSAIDRTKLPKRIKAEDCSNKSAMLQAIGQYNGMEGLSEEQWDEIRAVYLGMCMKVDDQFGRLCDSLKEAGIYDDSAIFFFSDHGDYAGDYGLVEKSQSSLEDCLTRVPLLIKPPKGYDLDAGVSDELCELVDFYATAMEMAGVTPSHSHFGRSLVPVLKDRDAQIREFVCCEGGRLPGELHCDEYHQANNAVSQPWDLYWPKKMAQKDDAAHAKATMIRTKQYKYISRITGEDEFYDLTVDLQETTNRIEDAEVAAEKMKLQISLMKWLQATSDIVPFDFDNRFTEEGLWNKVKSLVPPEYEEDVRSKIRAGMGIGALFGYCHSLRK